MELFVCGFRREVYSAPTLGGLSSDSDREHEDEDGPENDNHIDSEDIATLTSSDSSPGEEDTGSYRHCESE